MSAKKKKKRAVMLAVPALLKDVAPKDLARLRRNAAYHEAGHVVAAVAFGGRPRTVSIIPNLKDNLLGVAKVGARGPSSTYADIAQSMGAKYASLEFIEGTWVAMAGYVAEARWVGYSLAVFDKKVDLLSGADDRDDDIIHALQWAAWRSPDKQDDRPTLWRRVLRESRKVETFIAAHWGHVEAIARRLLREGKVSGAGMMRTLARLPDIARGG